MFIESVLTKAAAYVREQYGRRGALSIKTKTSDVDLVTEADVRTQQMLIDAIEAAFPGDAIVGEENGRDVLPTDRGRRCWVMDPIDGTHNFTRSLVPSFGVALAFIEGGAVQAGGVAMAGLDTLFLARRGGGATRDGKPIHVSTIDAIERAKIEVDFSRPVIRERVLGTIGRILEDAGQVRSHGSAVTALCAVAGGDAEAYVQPRLQIWDYAAPSIIITEAGGVITHLDGSPMDPFDNRGDILASNGAIHSTILRLLEK